MNDSQENKISMELGVERLLSENSSMTAGLPGYDPIYQAFKANVKEIQEIRELQEKSRKGIATRKADLRAVVEEMVLSLALKIDVYAKMNTDQVLTDEVNYSRSKLRKAADTIFKDMAEVVYNSAEANLANLADYGVTAGTLAELRNAIDAFNTAIPEPRLGTIAKKKATDRLRVLFKENDEYLKKLDLLLALLKDSKPEFYGEYRDARKVVETNRKINSLVGRVTNFTTGEGIKGVKIAFTAKKQNEIAGVAAECLSSDNGGFVVKSLPEGEYLAVIRKSGFMEKVVTVYIADGDTIKLNVAIETQEDYNKRLGIIV